MPVSSVPKLKLAMLLILFAFTLISFFNNAVRTIASPFALKALQNRSRKGAVASQSKICSQIGIGIMKDGGNAADAMVGTSFCLGVKIMYLTGLGGGGFMLVRSANGSYSVLDFRETAPLASSKDMFKNNSQASLSSGLACAVPGELRGLQLLHEIYGRLPWSRLIRPSINLARDGFIVDETLVTQMDSVSPNFLVNDPAWAEDFAPNGTRVRKGDTITRKRYSHLLEIIAKHGADAFYNGYVANATISAVKKAGGIMTTEDLANYSAIIRKPLQVNYRGFKLTSSGAPTSGTVVLNVMKVVEQYCDFGDYNTINTNTHRFDEAIRFGYGARVNLGDPSFNKSIQQYQEKMIHRSTIDKIRSKISDKHTLPVEDYNPDGLEILNTPGTSHTVTADASGLAISLTSTINLNFGSGVMVPETGLIMNNEMNDFSIPGTSRAIGYIASPANFIAPGKRPLSSISPVIVEFTKNSSLYFVTGAWGGSKIITATLQSLWHVLDKGQSLFEALDQPRFHDQLIPNQILFDYRYDNGTTEYMRQLGHNVSWFDRSSGISAIRLNTNGSFEAVGEPRFEGSEGLTW